MRVAVVVPDSSHLARAEQVWTGKTGPADERTVLVCAGTGSRAGPGYTVHTLDREVIARGAWRGLFRLVLAHLPRAERWFWSSGLFLILLPGLWPCLRFHIRSLDPDLVDLRWLPGGRVLKAKLAEFPQICVLARGDPPPALRTRGEWRKYDPDLKVSIVLPVFNGERYLRESLDSCLNQTHRNLELILVDDGSTDATPRIIAEYAGRDPRVLAIRNEKNLRLPGALNVGFRRATGDFLTWTSCDNNFGPTALEALVRYLCTWSDVDFVYSATRHIDESGRVIKRAVYRNPPWLLRDSNVIGSYFLYRRRIYEVLGGFRTDLEYVEDYEYWVRAYLRFRMMRLGFPLYDFRVHGESLTAQVRKLDLIETLRNRVRAQYFPGGRDRSRAQL